MTKQSHTVTGDKETAAESRDHNQLREPHSLKTTDALSSASLGTNASSPKSETGLLAALRLSNEGVENNDRQDAPRAIGETQPAVSLDQKPLVLLVEDTMELAEVIQAVLNRANLQIIHESHGGKALANYANISPDLILLDIGLPDITGWQFLEGIKERHKANGTTLPPVIVITAFGDPANRLVGKLQGVHDYLIKPFTAAEVERVVTSTLTT